MLATSFGYMAPAQKAYTAAESSVKNAKKKLSEENDKTNSLREALEKYSQASNQGSEPLVDIREAKLRFLYNIADTQDDYRVKFSGDLNGNADDSFSPIAEGSEIVSIDGNFSLTFESDERLRAFLDNIVDVYGASILELNIRAAADSNSPGSADGRIRLYGLTPADSSSTSGSEDVQDSESTN